MDRPTSSIEEQKQGFKRFLKTSVSLHVGLAALTLLKYLVWPSTPIDFTPTVQIDMVALPDILKNQNQAVLDKTVPVKDEPPPPPLPEAEAPTEKVKAPEPKVVEKDDSMTLKREKEAERDAKKALERLREQLKKNKVEEAERKREEIVDKKKEDLKRFQEVYRNALKGNQVNEGVSTSGDLKTTMNAYAGMVRERLRANWALPSYLQDKGLSASVRLYINSSGAVERMQVTTSSGNSMFDDYVKGTVNRSRFAPPPDEMSRGLRNSGMEVAFPL